MDPLSARLRDRRPGALGDLHVLSDELLCAVLGFLSPLDLGRLACVSSVMYILCNEEPLWMDKCLSSFRGLLEYRGSWKKTTLQNLGAKNNEACQKPLRFDGFNSLFLYRRWYRCFTKLSAFSSDNGDLERKEELTFDEFRSEYDGKKPVLLTDLADGWPAKTKWTTDQLLSNYGDVAFRMSQRSSKKITMKFKDYVSYMGLQHDEEPLYIFDDKFGEAAPALLNDYSVPYLFQEDFFDVLDHDQRPPFRWILIGPERTGASWHVDPALTTAWNTLLCGRKRWALYPPGRVPAGVTVHVNEEDGDVNVESPTSLQWWLDIYPQLADHDKPLECTQQPGETIFVPSGWWHCVLNLETTIAVTQNFVNQTNFEFVCLDTAPGYHHKGVCLAGSLAAKDKDIGNGDDCTYFETKVSNHHNMNLEEKRLKRYKAENDPYNNDGNWLPTDGFSEDHYNSRDKTFSYDIDFLSRFLDEERDHYLSLWRPSNFIAQKNMRDWLHKLWIVKPTMRQLIWKGACLSINVEKWYGCLLEILACHNLPSPLDDEKLPVGTGHNPVFLIADYVIKLYVEGGLESSIYDLGTELEFYNLLHEVNTPLTEHVPDVVASGFVVYENSCYRAVSWDGNGVPGEIASCYTVEESCIKDHFPFGVWSKKLFEIKKSGALSCLRIWPYIVTQRFRGDTFAHLRDTLSTNDVLHLASFLGDQLRNLHLLPLPPFHNLAQLKTNKMPLWTRTSSCQAEGSEISTAHSSTAFSEGFHIAREWDLVIASLDERKINIRKRLLQWGDPIPGLLIEKAEEYLPDNLAYLFDLVKGDDGLYRICGSPSWVHLDIMDDNILMEQRMPTNCSDRGPPHADSIVSGETDPFNVEGVNAKWSPAHIINFSYLSVGDPLYDLIPLYLDVFRGNICLLKHFLESYRLPLSKRTNHDAVVCESVENSKKFKRISYRAMCYCILHQDEILGAIFSLWKELRTATSWEEVEEAVWGELNNYQCPD